MAYNKQLYFFGVLKANNFSTNDIIPVNEEVYTTNLSYDTNYVTLKGGYKYILRAAGYGGGFDNDAGYLKLQFYNNKTSSFFGSRSFTVPTTWTAEGGCIQPAVLAFISPEVDTNISIRVQAAAQTPSLTNIHNELYIKSLPINDPGYKWVYLSQSADISNPSNGDPITWSKDDGNLELTTSSTITLPAGEYHLTAKSGGYPDPGGANLSYGWYRNDTAAEIGGRALHRGAAGNQARAAATEYAMAYFNPTEDTTVTLKAIEAGNLTTIYKARTAAYIESIPEFGAGRRAEHCWSYLSTNQSSPSEGDKAAFDVASGSIALASNSFSLHGGHLYEMATCCYHTWTDNAGYTDLNWYRDDTDAKIGLESQSLGTGYTTRYSCKGLASMLWEPDQDVDVSVRLALTNNPDNSPLSYCSKLLIKTLY